MLEKLTRPLRDKRGIALGSTLFIIVIVVFITTLVGAKIIEAQQEKKETMIETNKTNLEQSSRSFLLANGDYATLQSKLLKDFPQLTAHYNFQKILVEEYSLPQQEVNKRVQIVDIGSLTAESYFSGDIPRRDDYVIDNMTGKVYYIDENATLDELRKLAEEMLKDSDDVINLTVNDGDIVDLTVNGLNMTRVIASVKYNNTLVLGGGVAGVNDIKLMSVTINTTNGEVSARELVDLTSKVNNGNLKRPITDLRLIQPGQVLVHYYDEPSSEMKYEVIHF